MIDTVIFDLDGTLLNTLEDLRDSANHALESFFLPVRTTDEIRRFVGNGIRKLIERAVPENSSLETIDGVFNEFKKYYEMHCNDKTGPYPGIMELLQELKCRNIKMGITTNKAKFAAEKLNEIYFNGLIDVVAGAEDGKPTKPNPYMIEEEIIALESSKENILYLGDSQVDVATARNAGLRMIAVLWGFRSKSDLEKEGATEFIESPMELIKYL